MRKGFEIDDKERTKRLKKMIENVNSYTSQDKEWRECVEVVIYLMEQRVKDQGKESFCKNLYDFFIDGFKEALEFPEKLVFHQDGLGISLVLNDQGMYIRLKMDEKMDGNRSEEDRVILQVVF